MYVQPEYTRTNDGFYLQRGYSEIRGFSENILRFCEFLAHLTIHLFRTGVERGDAEATEMYCVALFILHVSIKLDQVFKWPYFIGVRSDRASQRTFWQYINPEHMAANRRCPLPDQFDFHVLPPGLEEYGPSIRVMAYLMWGRAHWILRDQVQIRIRDGVELVLNDPDGRVTDKDASTLKLKQVLKLGKFLHQLEMDGRKRSPGWINIRKAAGGRYKRWMRACGFTEYTEVPEITTNLDILAENRFLDHVKTVAELVSRRSRAEPRPPAPPKRPSGDSPAAVADKRSRTDYESESRMTDDVARSVVTVSVPESPECVDLPPTPDVINLEEQLPAAKDVFHPEENPGGRIPDIPKLTKRDVTPDVELPADEPSERGTITPTPSSPFPEVEVLESMEDAPPTENGTPAPATAPAPAPAPAPTPAVSTASASVPSPGMTSAGAQDQFNTLLQILTEVKENQKAIMDRLTDLEQDRQRVMLTGDLQLNILRRLQHVMLPTVLVTPRGSVPDPEPLPASAPSSGVEVGSPTQLPDVATLVLNSALPDLQPNPLYVAPAPALETTCPATDQMEVGGESDIDQGAEATDTASTAESMEVPTPAEKGDPLTAGEYLEHFDPLGTYSPASRMSVTEDDIVPTTDPLQPDVSMPQGPQDPEAEVGVTPKIDEDTRDASTSQDTYHPTDESSRVETAPRPLSVNQALERSQAVLSKTKTD